MTLGECEDNPYAVPTTVELAAMPAARREQPGPAAFMLRGLYAAMLTAPFIAVYQIVVHTAGLKFVASKWYLLGGWYVPGISIAGLGIAALGDGMTAVMCWKTVANRPKSLPLVAAAVGARILAALLQSAVLINVQKIPTGVEYFAAVSLHYGVPSVVLTGVFLRLANHRVSLWVYPMIYIAASVAGPMLSRSTRMIVTSMFGIVGTGEFVVVSTASQSLFLCFLAAALWFSVKLSRPAAIQFASHP